MSNAALEEAKAIGGDVQKLFERIAKLHLVEPMLAEHALKLIEKQQRLMGEFLAKTTGD